MHTRTLVGLPLALAAAIALSLGLRSKAPAPAAARPTAGSVSRFAQHAEVLERIRNQALEHGRSYEMLVELCTLAPHRLAGSPGAERAAEWAVATMQAVGLENVRLEECAVPSWERGSIERLTIVAPRELAGTELALHALGGSVATPEGGLRASVVEARGFQELRQLGEAARGKLVLLNEPMQDGLVDTFAAYGGAVYQRTQGAIEAARLGAAGVLVRSMTTRRDDVPHTGAMRYDERAPRIPAAAVSTRAADRLSELLRRGEPLELELELTCRWREDASSANVVGEIVGRETPEEIVLIGAHLDGWDVGQGAHDDAAGCSHVLEVARILRALDLRPRRSLRVVLFANEENGLAGGRAYRERHLEEMPRHVLALESDRGGFTPRGFTTDAEPATLEILREAALLLEPVWADRVLRGGGGADISPMRADGVPLVGYLPDSQRYFDVHHSERDTIETVSPRELQLGAAAIAGFAWMIAEEPVELPRREPR